MNNLIRKLGALLLLATPIVATAAYPDKPIRLIVTFAPGGASDIVARTISEPLGQKLGQPVIVDNRPGAGGSVGGLATVQAAPDGYTLMMANSTPLSIGPFVLDKQPYDPVKQFSHIFYAGSAPVLFMASPKTGIDSLAGLRPKTVSPLAAAVRRALATSAVNFSTRWLRGECFTWHTRAAHR